MDEYYFYVSKDKTEDLDTYSIMIVSAEYWDTNESLSDQHIAEEIANALKSDTFLDDFEEISEGIFVPTIEMTRPEIISHLKRIGLRQDKAFTAFGEENSNE